MNENYIVKKSNYFIMNSSYELSLEEQKLILTLASMVQPADEDFKPYKFKISEFIKLLGIENQGKYTEVPKITKELMKKVFEIEEDDMLIQTAWLSSALYKKGTGIVELEFSPRLKPYMLKLNNMFTQYKLSNILSMKSKYSPRIYEILKCNEYKKQRYIEIEIEELRKLLKIENVYPKYNDFKRYIIERTQKELNKVTDIGFEFEEIKTGRKVTSIRFYIQSRSPIVLDEVAAAKEDSEPIEIKDLIKEVKQIIDEKITTLEAKKILLAAKNDIDLIKEKYAISRKTNNIEGIVGWLIGAIKNDYSAPKRGTSSNNSFTNRKQRSYDLKEIERKLLGWDNLDKDENEDATIDKLREKHNL